MSEVCRSDTLPMADRLSIASKKRPRHSLLLLVPLLMGGPTKATSLGSVKEGSGQSWKARMLDLP